MRVALLLLALAGCAAPKAGQKCTAGDAFCSGTTQALVCRSAALEPFGCHGPKGCSVTGERAVLCDQSTGAAPGDACLPEYEGRGQCAPVFGAYLQCAKGTWVQLPCPPGKACTDQGGSLSCR